MATVKISALAALAAASISATDVMPIVDDIGGTPTTKSATVAAIRTALLTNAFTGTDYLAVGAGTIPSSGRIRHGAGTITTSDPLINSTATWNDAAVTFTHILVNLTDTASHAASKFYDYQIAGSSKASLTKAGALTLAAGLSATTGAFSSTVTGGTYNGQTISATASFTGTLAVAGAATFNALVTISQAGDAGININSASGSLTAVTRYQAAAASKWATGINITGADTRWELYNFTLGASPIIVSNSGAVTLSSTLAVGAKISSTLATGGMLELGNVTNGAGYNYAFGVQDGNGILISNAGADNSGAAKVAIISRDSGVGASLQLFRANGSTVGLRVLSNTRTTIGANGAATALTANPVGYLDIEIAGVNMQIPYYTRGA